VHVIAMRLFQWNRGYDERNYPVSWQYWPIRVGWVRDSCHAIICWHGWPADGSEWHPDATAVTCGWTLHIGALKIRFGMI